MKENGQKFECYSKKLYGFLVMKNFRYEISFKHNKTNKTCWVYEVTPEFSAALLEWKKNKPSSEA